MKRLVRYKRSSLFSLVVSDVLKSFILLTAVAKYIKLFWHNLCHYQHIVLSFDLGYGHKLHPNKFYEIYT